MFSEIYCVAHGKVQGVGYRDFVEGCAREFSLTGWVKNKPDGSVELVLQGIPDVLKRCTELLNQGSPLARVDTLIVEWRTPMKQFDEFRVISS